VKELQDRKKKLQQQLLYLKGKGSKPESSDEEEEPEKTKKVKKEAKSDDTAKGKKRKLEDNEDDFESTPQKKRKTLSDDPETVKRQIEKVDTQINKWNIKKTERVSYHLLPLTCANIYKQDELKTVALGTSKINYLDPRISAAWCKRAKVCFHSLF
jgi:DNA topoisomerase I